MSITPAVISDFTQSGVFASRDFFSNITANQSGITGNTQMHEGRPVLDISVRARQASRFLRQMSDTGSNLDADLSSRLALTGDAFAENFATGAIVLQKTLEKFADMAEKFARKNGAGAAFGRFLGISRRLAKGAENILNDFLDVANGLLANYDPGGAGGQVAETHDSLSLSAYFSQFEFQIEERRDGAFMSASITMVSIEVRIEQGAAESDPLALDLNGNGQIDLSGVDDGVYFDIDAVGGADRTSFVIRGDAFLALDANGNGIIDSKNELFGDTMGYKDGFASLGAYDINSDGVINSNDTVFDKLLLLKEVGNRGQILVSLANASISELNLGSTKVNHFLASGDRLSAISDFTYSDGAHGMLAEVWLSYR